MLKNIILKGVLLMRHELDHIDEQIIKLLHENARIPLKTIASQVFLSSPAVSARIERLEQAGIITGYTAKVNPAEIGRASCRERV